MKRDGLSRREFMKRSVAGLAAAGLASTGLAFGADDPQGEGVPTRPFGDTGERVSILGVGGYHLGTIRDDKTAIRLVREAIDSGVTFMDNAWEYHRGRSEELMGKALQDGYREKAFLMTKHHGRKSKKEALEQLDQSLRRLKTEVIDLWQYHEVIYQDDPEMIFSEGGAIEAAEVARKAGKVRFIGFTGHKHPKLFRQMLKHDFPWDAVQMPVNVLDPHYLSFQREILPILQKRKIASIAMKTLCGGYVMETGVVKPREAMRYAWSRPVATIVSGMDSLKLLRTNTNYARTFEPMSEREERALLQRVSEVAQKGKYEPFKSSRRFDGWRGRQLHDID